ncbi:MAG: kinase [Desulfovibrionales bacterium]|jgi:NAD+ kinase|nr:kinase [Desulfovibrionales bacterium]
MANAITSVLIVLKTNHELAEGLGAEIETWLCSRGINVCMDRELAGRAQAADVDYDCEFDLILVLGGDGTYINVARALLHTGVPLLGVNLGKVGFLADIPVDRWRERLEAILEQGVSTERRLVMSFEVRREGQTVRRGLAVNDLVVSRGQMARLVQLAVSCEGAHVSNLRADGVIIATPIGSTAYTVSAGGPITHPSLRAFTLTPICPFLNDLRPLVLPGDCEFTVRVTQAVGGVFLTEDGQSGMDLFCGDEIVIRPSGTDLIVASVGFEEYFHKLRSKGFIIEGGG